ncbi:TolC family protein [uncultured Rikenella sp.]|uniref:TolC family protein n=1 Tax=uncultured Rikenella sp. TaxID=368003 RepID=UPI00260583DA|nr:TolC family protein [uncultured Rikenella sp.]
MMTKRILSIIWLSCATTVAGAQGTAVTLDACRRAAVERSPLSARQTLVGEKRKAQDRATSSSLLPQLEIQAQGSYQNEVPKLPTDFPLPVTMDLPKDQYRATVELNQVIYAGHSVRNTKRLHAATAEVETASLAVELDRLRDRINRTYIGILLTEKQLEVNRLMRETLESNLRAVTARMEQGMATGAEQASLAARMLELNQERIALSGERAKYITALTKLTGMEITERTYFEIPPVPTEGIPDGEAAPFKKRSEMKLYAEQRNLLEAQNRMSNSRSNPQLSLFASGGYGRPGYDLFDRNFAPMAIGGLRFRLPLTSWDATQKEKKINRVAGRDIDQQQRDFERNVSIEAAQYRVQIERLQETIQLDPTLVEARKVVREQAQAQFEQGVITATEYLTEFNNEAAARISAEVNALRLVEAWIAYQAVRGIYN